MPGTRVNTQAVDLRFLRGTPVTPGILVTLPVRTRNPGNGATGNSRLAAIIRGQRRARERALTKMAVASALAMGRFNPQAAAPWKVRITRISPGRADWVNLGAFLKGVIDGVAEALGIDDGDEARVRWVLEQRKGKRGEHGVEVLLMPTFANPAVVQGRLVE